MRVSGATRLLATSHSTIANHQSMRRCAPIANRCSMLAKSKICARCAPTAARLSGPCPLCAVRYDLRPTKFNARCFCFLEPSRLDARSSPRYRLRTIGSALSAGGAWASHSGEVFQIGQYRPSAMRRARIFIVVRARQGIGFLPTLSGWRSCEFVITELSGPRR